MLMSDNLDYKTNLHFWMLHNFCNVSTQNLNIKDILTNRKQVRKLTKYDESHQCCKENSPSESALYSIVDTNEFPSSLYSQSGLRKREHFGANMQSRRVTDTLICRWLKVQIGILDVFPRWHSKKAGFIVCEAVIAIATCSSMPFLKNSTAVGSSVLK